MMRRETFLRELNHSYRYGSLGGQFNDRELAGYVAYKRRKHGPFRSLLAVSNVGKQPNGTWALNKELFFDNKGQRIQAEASGSLWIGHLHSGPGVVAQSEELQITTPLGCEGLRVLILEMEQLFGGMYTIHCITSHGLRRLYRPCKYSEI